MSNGLATVDIICPTWNNEQYLIPFLNSVLSLRNSYTIRIILVNNGHPALENSIPKGDSIKFVQAPENLGWEGGLKLGLKHSDAEYVVFANDDIHVPISSSNWIRELLGCFNDPSVGAAGPTSNCVMGSQSIWSEIIRENHKAPFLIGFCMMVRREALDKVGGIDDTLPGGDDIDLSIRLRDAGYYLAVNRKVFVYHHGFKTGTRIHGGSDVAGGWNSKEMSERTEFALIKKHGFKKYFNMINRVFYDDVSRLDDVEGEIIRTLVGNSKGPVLELGCGGKKTIPNGIGVDFYGKGEHIPIIGAVSVADIKASVTSIPKNIGKFDFIIARHILEHIVDPIQAIRHWSEFLTRNGKLIIAVPDDRLVDSIPLNPEHKHVFSKNSLKNLCGVAGLITEQIQESGNTISMISVSRLPDVALETASTENVFVGATS